MCVCVSVCVCVCIYMSIIYYLQVALYAEFVYICIHKLCTKTLFTVPVVFILLKSLSICNCLQWH